MHVDVPLRRAAVAPSGRSLLIAVFVVIAALAAVALAVESSVLLPASAIARYKAASATLSAWAVEHLPASLLPLARTFAALLLSPLLYLGLAAVLLAERFAPADDEQRPLSHGLIHDGFAWFLIDAPLKAFLFTGLLGALYWLLDNYAPFMRIDPEITAMFPTWSLVLFVVIAGDLLKWLHHYLSHKVEFLWHFHSVHHSQRELNLFTQARFHAVDVATLAPILYTPLYVLNLDFELAVWIVLLTDWYGRVTHANLRTNFAFLRHAFVTPQSHRIHHSREERHHDKNFGTLFCIWDRLFGTEWPDHNEYPATGIADDSFPWEESVRGTCVLSNYFAQLVYPFRQIFKSSRSRFGEGELVEK